MGSWREVRIADARPRTLNGMTTFAGVVLLVSAFFNVIVWPQFWRRVTADPRARDEAGKSTSFFRVHAILIAFALVIAAVSAVAGILLLTVGGTP